MILKNAMLWSLQRHLKLQSMVENGLFMKKIKKNRQRDLTL